MMIKRTLLADILQNLKRFPVVGLVGPRQVGKTTLARAVRKEAPKKTVYLDLELPSDMGKLSEPELYLRQHADSLVIIDEVQRMPSLFPVLRAVVDQRRFPGRFLLLGSAAPELTRQASESLAGRIVYHELTPLSVAEVGGRRLPDLWLRGGFPLSFLAEDDEASLEWRETFVRTYLERDIPQLGIRVPVPQLRRFWTMLAHMNAQLWNGSQIANSLGISPPTARHYLDILEETFIVRQLQPYHANVKKRLIKSPKIYLRDSGLLHALLDIRTSEYLAGSPHLGASWESFCLEQALRLFPAGKESWFYRTQVGAEIDLILHDRKGRPVAIEIKYSAAPKVSRGYWIAFEELKCAQGFVIYPGTEEYPIHENVSAFPAAKLPELRERI